MTTSYRVLCVSEAMSPITHAQGTAGNESLIAREPVLTDRGVVNVPVLSGNAIRHRLIREPGARWLVEEYGLEGKLSLSQLYFLFNGGALTDGGGRENTRLIADMQRVLPLYRLVGGAIPSQILAGSLQVGRGTLVCEENRAVLNSMLPADSLPDEIIPAEQCVGNWQYTRGDTAAHRPELLAEAVPAGTKSNMMPFAGQAVVRGSLFVHDFILPHVSEIELGALLWSLRLWQAEGGTVGGQAARGHGRLKTQVGLPDGAEQDALCRAYCEHARSVKAEAVAWLETVFKSKPIVDGDATADEKPKRGKGKK